MKRLALLGLLLCSAASGQSRDTTVVRIRPVDVTVTRAGGTDIRTPASISVVGKSDIQGAQPGVGLDESLAMIPGLTVNNRYNLALGSRIAIRGLGARAAFGVRGIRVLVDGVPLTMPDGQANLNNVDLGSAGRIEVLRGPASSLYGNAAGGVISIESESPAAGRFNAEARTLFGDPGGSDLGRLQRHSAKLSGATDGFDYLLSVARLDTDGFRAHSAAEQSSLNSRIRFGRDTRVSIVLNHADAPVAQNPGSLPADSARLKPSMAWPRNVATGAGEAARQTQLGIGIERGQGSTQFKANAYGLTRSLENPLPFAYIQLDRAAGGLRAAANHARQFVGRTASITAGADVELQRDDRAEFNNANGAAGTQRQRDQQDQVFSVGPFMQAGVAITERLQLEAGARYDWVRFATDDRLLTDNRDDSGDRMLQAFSPRVAALYRLSATQSVFGSIASAFQTPTTTELINRPPVSGQTCCPGGFNADLEPQRALNFEIGWKGVISDYARFELAAYHMRVTDALVPFQVAGADGREFFRNAGRTRQRGVEAAASFVPVRWATADISYTFSDFTFDDDGNAATSFEGNEVPGVAPHHLVTRLRVEPVGGLRLELEHDYTSRYFADDANLNSNSAAAVVDARLAWETALGDTRVAPFMGINNLTDVAYNSSVVINAAGARFYEPAPGRNLYLGLTIRVSR